jgi:hypothetical protein
VIGTHANYPSLVDAIFHYLNFWLINHSSPNEGHLLIEESEHRLFVFAALCDGFCCGFPIGKVPAGEVPPCSTRWEKGPAKLSLVLDVLRMGCLPLWC